MEQEHNIDLTPDELDDLLSRLLARSSRARPSGETNADAAFLAQLVNTARATQLDAPFFTRLAARIKRHPGRVKPSHAAPRRQLALSVSGALVVISFVALSLFSWTAESATAHAATYTPNLVPALVPDQTQLPFDVTTTRLPPNADQPAVAIVAAPAPADTPVPSATYADGLALTPAEH
jgi:hypothetical protein